MAEEGKGRFGNGERGGKLESRRVVRWRVVGRERRERLFCGCFLNFHKASNELIVHM